jgi:hypothetical protein
MVRDSAPFHGLLSKLPDFGRAFFFALQFPYQKMKDTKAK